MIVVVDYKKGNLLSVERGLVCAGATDVLVSSDPADIARADAVVLPGVGAFADAAATMEELGQMQAIRDRVAAGAPFLGICLGLHLMYEDGVEGAAEGEPNPRGLGLIPGTVTRMPQTDEAGTLYKIPHVGWNSITPHADDWAACPILEGVAEGEYFYFTHSYVAPVTSAVVATAQHSCTIPAVVQASDRVFGAQFHPEKSSDAGAQILRNFVALVEGANDAC